MYWSTEGTFEPSRDSKLVGNVDESRSRSGARQRCSSKLLFCALVVSASRLTCLIITRSAKTLRDLLSHRLDVLNNEMSVRSQIGSFQVCGRACRTFSSAAWIPGSRSSSDIVCLKRYIEWRICDFLEKGMFTCTPGISPRTSPQISPAFQFSCYLVFGHD